MVLTLPALTMLTTMAYLLIMLRSLLRRSLLRRKQGHDNTTRTRTVTADAPDHSLSLSNPLRKVL